MALIAVVLDSSPVGLVTQKAGKSPDGDACRAWMEDLLVHGVRVYVPEVADYEVRRELLRADKPGSIIRLDRLKRLARCLPLTTDVMLEAAALWAQSRNAGVATADIHALDGDVIAAAQALSVGLAPAEFRHRDQQRQAYLPPCPRRLVEQHQAVGVGPPILVRSPL